MRKFESINNFEHELNRASGLVCVPTVMVDSYCKYHGSSGFQGLSPELVADFRGNNMKMPFFYDGVQLPTVIQKDWLGRRKTEPPRQTGDLYIVPQESTRVGIKVLQHPVTDSRGGVYEYMAFKGIGWIHQSVSSESTNLSQENRRFSARGFGVEAGQRRGSFIDRETMGMLHYDYAYTYAVKSLRVPKDKNGKQFRTNPYLAICHLQEYWNAKTRRVENVEGSTVEEYDPSVIVTLCRSPFRIQNPHEKRRLDNAIGRQTALHNAIVRLGQEFAGYESKADATQYLRFMTILLANGVGTLHFRAKQAHTNLVSGEKWPSNVSLAGEIVDLDTLINFDDKANNGNWKDLQDLDIDNSYKLLGWLFYEVQQSYPLKCTINELKQLYLSHYRKQGQ